MRERRAGRANRALVFLAHVAAGAWLALLVLAFSVPAIEETRWAFTEVVPDRVCADGESGSCVARTAALVVAADESRFTVSYDDARRARSVHVVDGPAPPVGTHVVLEEWKDRLVSVLPASGSRRHAQNWPNRRRDLAEGLSAIGGILLTASTLIWMIVRLAVRSDPPAVTYHTVSERPGRT